MGLLTRWLSKQRRNQISHHLRGDVLDIGCGNADVNVEFGALISSYTGVDFNKDNINQLSNKFTNASFYEYDLDKDILSFNKRFDTILLLAVIEHIFNLKHLFEQLLECLDDNGQIILTTPTNFGNDVVHKLGSKIGLFSQRDGQDDHIVIFNKKRFEILASEFNLELVRYKKFQLGCNQIVILKRKK